MQTHVSTKRQNIIPAPSYGIFELRCDNSKKRAGKPVVHVTAFGSLYPDGKVHLHTQSIGVTDFITLRQMCNYLLAWGEYRIDWIAGPLPKGEEE